MKQFKKILDKIFLLPPIPTVFAAVLGYGLVLIVAVFHIENSFMQMVSYIASAYALIVTITGLPYLKLVSEKIRIYIFSHSLMKKFRSTVIGERFLTDIRFRTGVSLGQGLVINLLYIAIKLFSGIYYRSTWFISLAAYYALLAVLRFMLVRHVHVRDMKLELHRYQLCGFVLLLMNQALAVLVIFMVYHNKGFNYPGLLIYAMGLYAFYAVITAIINVVKTRRHNSPILSAAKAINLVAAMVSILSLTTAMLSQFGGDNAPMFSKIMTGATGGSVCTIVIGMAVYMIWRANRSLKNLDFDDFQTKLET